MEKILYDYALSFVGTHYLWGGNNPLTGMDCSGLVLELLRSIGAWGKIDDTAQGIYGTFGGMKAKSNYAFGDILYFGKSTTQITHVTMSLGSGLMIEAGAGGSTTTSKDAAAKQSAFVRVRPINNRADLVAVTAFVTVLSRSKV